MFNYFQSKACELSPLHGFVANFAFIQKKHCAALLIPDDSQKQVKELDLGFGRRLS